MKITVLGCGTSGGVPRVGNQWGACDPSDPRNRRRRVSVLVEEGGQTILIDTSPDLREQLLDARVSRIDAVLWTHDHADHTHGLDDLRGLAQLMGVRIPAYADARTLGILEQRFGYIFHGSGGYPPILEGRTINGPVRVGEVDIHPFTQEHGEITSLGFRIKDFAYSTDLNGIPESSAPYLEGLGLWIVDALRHAPHPTHPHLDLTLSWIKRFNPRRSVLTHMDKDLDYLTLKASLPDGVEPGFDGMEIIL